MGDPLYFAMWDKAYRHAHRALPSYISYQHPSLFEGNHCVLCEKDLETDVDRNAHCHDVKHRGRVGALFGLQKSKVAMQCAMLQNRLDAEMPDRNSHLPVRLEMYWILLNCHPSASVRWFPEVLTDQSTAMIDEYLHKQRMGLLELAVWKATCLVRMQWSPGGTTEDCWRHGWKVNKSATRNSNEIGIILRAVLPFMGSRISRGDL
jgi:hypothetical protein